MYVKDLKKKILVIKNGGISRWTLTTFHHCDVYFTCTSAILPTLAMFPVRSAMERESTNQ